MGSCKIRYLFIYAESSTVALPFLLTLYRTAGVVWTIMGTCEQKKKKECDLYLTSDIFIQNFNLICFLEF